MSLELYGIWDFDATDPLIATYPLNVAWGPFAGLEVVEQERLGF
jgi:hypothetical protein